VKKLLLLVLLAGCATNPDFREGRRMLEAGNEEEGLALMEQAAKDDPENREVRNYYERHRQVAVQRYLWQGDHARSAGAPDAAEAAYRRALRFDPGNARAQAGIDAAQKDRAALADARAAQAALQAGDDKTALERAKAALAASPGQRDARDIVRAIETRKAAAEQLPEPINAALGKTITIELREAPVRSVFELISKRTGLNFVYDRDIPAELRTTLFVRDTPIEDVLSMILVTSQLDRRVLNENTLLIYPNTPQKAQVYKQLMVRSFYLENADARQTASLVRALVKTRDIFVDEKLNLMVIRDTPEAVRVVEKLVASQDLREPEVMLEVEVLEVSHSQLRTLGVQWPTSVGLSLIGAANVPGQISGSELRSFGAEDVRVTVNDPFLALNLREVAGRNNVLANPRIRVRNKEKARIHIGDKVPVITTTAGATGFVSESINYLDVGLKLEVEPQVHLDNDVAIRVGLEVSNLSSQTRSASGTVAYQVGTRNAATVLRLRDGETQVLAGLISDEDRRTANRVPGLADLPLLGRLFASHDDTLSKTEVVLLVTPRVVRNIQRPGPHIESFNSGSELEVGGVGAPVVSTFVPPAPSAPTPPQTSATPTPPAAGPQSGGQQPGPLR
jgi:general secretion pathway protein D